MMEEAVENVCVREIDLSPVPPVAPTDFSVILGAVMAGETESRLEREMEALGGPEEAMSGFLSWMQWVEVEVRGIPDLLEGLGRLKGAVMSVGASMEGEL
jgi:hypothetical protein